MTVAEWISQRRNIRGQTVYVFWRHRNFPDAWLGVQWTQNVHTGDMYIASRPNADS